VLTVDFARLPIAPGDRVLDLGCGGGRHAFEVLRRGGRVVALDASVTELRNVTGMFAAMAAEGEAGRGGSGQVVAADATALPFGDSSFDHVIAAEILEHVAADQAAIDELARVLRPGGVAAITVPAWLPERICWRLSEDYHTVPGGHIRIFTRAELTTKLERGGLAVSGRHQAHALHSPYWWLKCAVGVRNGDHPLARAYHRFLVWDIVRRPAVTRLAERLLNPLLGKSVVYYAVKNPRTAPGSDPKAAHAAR
jgi:SAM-dependent methyltransferase